MPLQTGQWLPQTLTLAELPMLSAAQPAGPKPAPSRLLRRCIHAHMKGAFPPSLQGGGIILRRVRWRHAAPTVSWSAKWEGPLPRLGRTPMHRTGYVMPRRRAAEAPTAHHLTGGGAGAGRIEE